MNVRVFVGGCVAGVVLVGLAGCSRTIVGHYDLVRSTPNPDAFAIDDADFDRDGRYAALVTIGGHTARETGEYEFNGYKLTLRPAAGGQRKYNATVKPGRLEVFSGKRAVYLKRTGKPQTGGGEPAS